MPTSQLIAATEFCIYHNIELSFIESLQQSGLITVVVQEERIFVEENELPQLEKMVRLYHEMDINLEGIETITYLLQRMNDMQRQIAELNKRLSLYEG
ncbi:chaperone modulator CbpM [Ferruginibacter paludis]|uniref:chaperone modulator CbpM n=1 Tax=Ferruginibacter paludis TaxID=1310417 RepID=UPI0025B29D31|nr:chaperone modulator CbpM [Ferruginibacter paludis]MDN3658753.1 chaperone modulator CbpM [Ferruginibacter paludis]